MIYPHESVLKEEVLKLFSGRKISLFVDGTLGAGGHAHALLSAHPEIATYIGIDQDPEALAIAKERLRSWDGKVDFVYGNYADVGTILRNKGIASVDGILLDLGVSSMQLDRAEKGFSFMREGPLDMRMDPNSPLTAAIIVNTWPEKDIGRVFREYGEEKFWRRAAHAVVTARIEAPIETTLQLANILLPVLPKQKKKINPLTCIFQALRICVNRELEVLEATLPVMISHLSPKGILGVISFHSLEDRIVKNIFRSMASDKENTSGLCGLFLDKEPVVNILTRKPHIAQDDEMERNPRSRSAKLRGVEKR